MAHEQSSSQNNEGGAAAALSKDDAGLRAEETPSPPETESTEPAPGSDGAGNGSDGHTSAPSALDLPPGVDDETAELLRTLEMPSVGSSPAEPDGENVPLAGVLRRKRRPRSRAVAALDEPTVRDADSTVPDVIAYEPIRVEAPWAREVEVGTPRRDTIETEAYSTETRAEVPREPAPEPDTDAGFEEGDAPPDDETSPVEPTPAVDLDDEDVDDDEDVAVVSADAALAAAPDTGTVELDEIDEIDEIDEVDEVDEVEVEEVDSGDEAAVEAVAATPARPPSTTAAPSDAAGRKGARRPPMPPPPPRRVKEGEVVLAQTALDEMLAGGRADDGRDLSDEPPPDREWHKEIFTEDYFRTLPKNFHRQTLREAEFIVDRLGMEPGARLLDLACGFGRHTMELSKRGFELVGLDLAMPLLQKALNEAQRRGLSIKFVHGDMRELNFEGVFDGIFNVQTSFGYFSDRLNFKVLQGIRRALKPGGRFLIETVNRDFICEELPTRIWWEGTECLILEEVDFDYSASVLRVKRSFVFEDSNRDPWEQGIHVRLYSAHELESLLRRAGFDIVELSGDFSYPGRFFGSASRRVIVVAERPVD